MTIKNSVSDNFLSMFVDCIDVFDCRLPGVMLACTLDPYPATSFLFCKCRLLFTSVAHSQVHFRLDFIMDEKLV